MEVNVDTIREFDDNKLIELIQCDDEDFEPIRIEADKVRRANYGTDVFLRGLIEFTIIVAYVVVIRTLIDTG